MSEIGPLVLTVFISLALFSLGYWKCYDRGSKYNEKIIKATIIKLCEDGYLYHYRKSDGELEIQTITEYNLDNIDHEQSIEVNE